MADTIRTRAQIVTSLTVPTGSGAITGQVLRDSLISTVLRPNEPSADRILFWDQSAGREDWLTVVSGVNINGTTLYVTALDTTNFAANIIDIDGTLATNSDTRIATQKATKTYVDTVATGKANLASPIFTGVPSAPTAANGTNTTQIATTAFVLANATGGGGGGSFSGLTSYSKSVKAGTGQVFGTSDAVVAHDSVTGEITLMTTGTYQLSAFINLNHAGSTTTYGSHNFSYSLYRTNNTPGTIPDTNQLIYWPTRTAYTGTGGQANVMKIYSTTTTGDTVQLRAYNPNGLGAGQLYSIGFTYTAIKIG